MRSKVCGPSRLHNNILTTERHVAGLDKRIQAGLDGEYSTVDNAIEEAAKEVGMRNEYEL